MKILPKGDNYTGHWLNEKKHGQGTYKWLLGNKYEGEWLNDMRHGNGTFTWADGD